MQSKVREKAKAMSLAFVLLDFHHAGGSQKESVVCKTECTHVAIWRGKQDHNCL